MTDEEFDRALESIWGAIESEWGSRACPEREPMREYVERLRERDSRWRDIAWDLGSYLAAVCPPTSMVSDARDRGALLRTSWTTDGGRTVIEAAYGDDVLSNLEAFLAEFISLREDS